MSGHTLNLPWADEEICLHLPDAWQLTGVLEPSRMPPVEDATIELARSLAEPFGSRRLRDLCGPGAQVAVVMDDGSRPTPVHQILPTVLAELAAAGVRHEDVVLVPALGLHRPMTREEVLVRAGSEASGLRCETHNCDDPDTLAFLGTTKRGTPVHINKVVAQAQVVVSIGCIEPHIIASFGGGYKNIVPGVAGRATIAHNHGLNCTSETFNMAGQPIDGNPMRLDLEEAGGMLRPPVFIVNAVLNSRGQIVRIVSGDPVAAHRAGANVSAQLYGARLPTAPADIVIADSHPMDQDLRQGVKALANTIRAVRPGGVHITMVRASEGVGVFGLANQKLPLGPAALRFAAPLLVQAVPRLKVKGLGEEDRFFLYFALQAMRRCTLLMYAPTIPSEIRNGLPFVQFVDSPEQAIAVAKRRFPQRAQVLAFPYGGTTYPVLA